MNETDALNTQDSQPPEQAETNTPSGPQFSQFGCITAVVLLGLGILICSAGNRWLFEPQSIFGQDYGSLATSTFVSGLSQALLLLVAGLVMFFIRRENLHLIRGVGAGLIVSAIYTAINSAFIAWEAPLTYPGIADWLPPVTLIIIGVILIAVLSRAALKPIFPAMLLGLGLGILVTAPWAYTGSLGEFGETAAAVANSLAFGLWIGLATSMVFYFEDPNQERHILWSTLIAAGFTGALLPTFLTGRSDYVMTAVLITPLITAIPLGAMLAAWPLNLSAKNRWLPVAAFYSGFLLIPLLFFEGVELEFMPEISVKMAAGLFFVSIAAITCAAIWLVLYLISGPKTAIGRSLALLISAIVIVAVGIFTTEGGAWQTDTFFVLMADQADTQFALDISERDVRVTAVYDTLVEQANADQADIRQFLDDKSATYTPFYLINALEVQGGPLLRWQLSRRSDIDRIIDSPHPRPERIWFEPVTDLSMTGLTSAEPAPSEPVWGIEEVNAPQVWSEFGTTGEGIIVGSADSGVEFTHPALLSNYLGTADNHDYTWFDPGLGSSSPVDSGGHGTHTTGTIVGQSGIGVAPGAKWIACRNLPKNLGNPADYLACMQFLFAPFPIGGDPFTSGDPTRGAHLTNNSWGCPPEEGCDGQTMGIGIHHLRNAGQMMVISNGNSGPACDTTGVPATNDDAFSVGALNPSGNMAGFSSRGPAVDYDGDLIIKPDIIAPGVEIVSSLPGNTYGPSQGTSMAGPHVAGVVALLWSAAPELIGNIDQTEQILVATARQIQTTERCIDGVTDGAEVNTDSGHGIIDALAAVREALGN
ncbi:MAG: S8 family serine peptidase [Anaerolineae bacterium]